MLTMRNPMHPLKHAISRCQREIACSLVASREQQHNC